MARLTRDLIVSAAINVMGDVGFEHLSVRKLGEALDADPTAIYRHFRSKDELLRAMGDRSLAGVVDGRDCGDPQIGDADSAPNTDRHTPHDLGAALDALEADTVLCEAMGADLVKAFLTIRTDELKKWKSAAGTWDVESTSSWELEKYLPFY
jgi:AcrR family transcriptional regulator